MFLLLGPCSSRHNVAVSALGVTEATREQRTHAAHYVGDCETVSSLRPTRDTMPNKQIYGEGCL